MKRVDASQFAVSQYYLHCKYFYTCVETSSNIKIVQDFVA